MPALLGKTVTSVELFVMSFGEIAASCSVSYCGVVIHVSMVFYWLFLHENIILKNKSDGSISISSSKRLRGRGKSCKYVCCLLWVHKCRGGSTMGHLGQMPPPFPYPQTPNPFSWNNNALNGYISE